jgi:hypothetical protein
MLIILFNERIKDYRFDLASISKNYITHQRVLGPRGGLCPVLLMCNPQGRSSSRGINRLMIKKLQKSHLILITKIIGKVFYIFTVCSECQVRVCIE